MGFIEVTPDQPCPVCDKTDWCRVDIETKLAECHRPYGDPLKYTDSGFGIYRMGTDIEYTKPPESENKIKGPSRQKAAPPDLDRVYSSFLSKLSLLQKHRSSLSERGLSDTNISDLCYRSMPLPPDKRSLVDQLRSEFGDKLLSTIPGFVSQGGRVTKLLGHSGILVPCRSLRGEVQGFQIRSDEGRGYRWLSSQDCSISSPIHFSGSKSGKELWLTEGIIKADVSSIKLGCPVIGFAGVSAWMNQRESLKDLILSTDSSTIIIAFDADADDKVTVRKALQSLSSYLDELSLSVKIAQWDISDGKGIDDLLHNGHTPTIYASDEAPDYVDRLIDRATDLPSKPQLAAIKSILSEIKDSDPIDQTVYLSSMKQRGFGGLTDLRRQLKLMDGTDPSEPSSVSASPISSPSTDSTDSQPPGKSSICLSTSSGPGRRDPYDIIERDLLPSIIELLATDPDLFVRGGKLVRVKTDENDRASIEEHTLDTIKIWLGSHFHFYMLRVKGDDSYPVTVPTPTDLARGLLAWRVYPPGIPSLEIVTEFPIMTSGGVHNDAGYHAESKAYLVQSGSVDYESIVVDTDSLSWAKRQIFDELLYDFRFDDTASRSNFIAYLLSFPMRPAIPDAVPMYTVTAPVQGTGKTLLVDLAHIIWTGRKADAIQSGANEHTDREEWRKRILPYLLDGKASLFFDNVTGIVSSNALASALTANWYTDRMLSVSEQRTVRVRCLWSMGGNNIEFQGDMPRRIYHTKINVNMESPETRSGFKHPKITNWTYRNRVVLMTACMTLIKSWDEQGRPPDESIKWGSYEDFASIMGGILRSAGISDFLSNREGMIPQDIDAWREFFRAWSDKYGAINGTDIGRLVDGEWKSDDVEDPQPSVSVKDLMPIASRRDGEDEDLEILGQWLTANTEQSRRIRLGKLMIQNLERIYGDYKLEKLNKKVGGANHFRLVLANTEPSSSGPVPFELDDLLDDVNDSAAGSLESSIDVAEIDMGIKIRLRSMLSKNVSRPAIEQALSLYISGDASGARETLANAENNT